MPHIQASTLLIPKTDPIPSYIFLEVIARCDYVEFYSQFTDLSRVATLPVWTGDCPYCGDDEGSFLVAGRLHHCRSCHKGGSVLSISQALYQLSVREALQDIHSYAAPTCDCCGNRHYTHEMVTFPPSEPSQLLTFLEVQESILLCQACASSFLNFADSTPVNTVHKHQ